MTDAPPMAGSMTFDRTIHILHLITGLGSGGAEMMLYKLLSRMDRSRFTNVVVSMTDAGSIGARVEALGVPVYSLDMRPGYPDPRGVWKFWRLLRQERPHLLQAWMYHADVLGLLVGKLARVPYIAWNIRCSNMDMRYYSRLSGLMVRLHAKLARFPQVVLVNSEAGREFHEMLQHHPRRWEVVPNGFDTDMLWPNPEARVAFRRTLGVKEATFLVGMVARYDPMKDHATFLRAARSLLTERCDVRFVLVGKGMSRDNAELSRIIDDLQLQEHVHLCGEASDISGMLPALDVVSLSSAFGEGFPNVIGEAMACGVPCVVTDVGDAGHIVGDTGLVVPPQNPEALAAAWQKILVLPAEERVALGHKARCRLVARYSLSDIVRRYESVYASLLLEDVRRP